ncbi:MULTISPECIES: S-methyl-5-thioribose-1-phosphate isomerase [Crateriforma]|uniref:Methylthioribose-1-phosphate isomerase n=1 Tax=Crateriforma conspicua TaxID=2527996 RepID=A0A5C6FWR2_9PLAN|nr:MULTISPECIES: S-methyl-5-thioribose-1-phosphate isomerase [Crateriforma]TWU67437.1 Methylthioribose-1-phosphate isomerase [Crateriforma conspicua]
MSTATDTAETIIFHDGQLDLLDQTKLPTELTRLVCTNIEQAHDAIRRLVVRGAPAIGIAAAYGVLLQGRDADRQAFGEAMDYLATSRPTAVNLFWAMDRMRDVMNSHDDDATLYERLHREAVAIHDEDRQMCRSIGANGAALIQGCRNVLTHCNAGGLATSMWGTALAPIYHLHEQGKAPHVFADETRPLLQGARLTAWELSQAGVAVTVLTDSMSGGLMRSGQVDAVIVGADRIAANGDAANKIGTYPLAVLAKYHKIPFYVAAPTNTFDLKLPAGDQIPIEQRHRDEVARPGGVQFVPDAADVINPAFDVTPAELIDAIVTEKGVIRSPTTETVGQHFAN